MSRKPLDDEWREEAAMQLLDLKTLIHGEILLPGDEGYDEERAGWNLLIEHRPALIVAAACHLDVEAAVAFAESQDLPVAVQATGHGASVPADGAVLISTRHMTNLEIDPEMAIARIGPGVTWNAVVEEATPFGFAPLVGTTPDVGVVGYLTSGGLPLLGREFGFAADHVRAIELVTADGQMRRATPAEHPDLFWAVRGGKGNFGVVTSIETGLMPIARLYAGELLFPGEATSLVVGAWLEWTRDLPEEMTTSLTLARFPDQPGGPDPLRGTVKVRIRVAYTGSNDDGERLVRPLRALGPIGDTVADTPLGRIGDVLKDPSDPIPVRDRGRLLHELDGAAVERLTALAGPDADLPAGQIEIRLLGGALSRRPDVPNAVGHRDAAFSVLLAMIAGPERVEQVDAIQQTLIDGLAPWDTGRTLPNFLGSGETQPHQVRAAYRAADYERLTGIKAAYDPRNLFRINHNIPPKVASLPKS